MSNKFQFDNVIEKLDAAANAVYAAQDTLVRDVTDALSKLHNHILDPDAHGFTDPDSFFRKLLDQIIKDGISNSVSGGSLQEVLNTVSADITRITNTLDAHTSNRSNPHNVTKEQLGLSNIPNSVSDSVTSDSNSQLATSKAVKTAYDLAYAAVKRAGDTMTGNLFIKKDLPVYGVADTGLNTNVAPSADTYRKFFSILDRNNIEIGGMEGVYLKNKSGGYRLFASKVVGGTTKRGYLGIYTDLNGNAYTEAPQPPTNDTSTKIATTNWVQNTIKTRMETDVVVATTKKAGMVKPDGTTIMIKADGTIYVDKISVATTTTAGTVIPDNVTIKIDAAGKIRVDAKEEIVGSAIVKRRADGQINGTVTGNAHWADLAEVYHSSEELKAGEIVTVGYGNKEGAICKASSNDFVLGVVSEKPAITLNLKEIKLENRYPIARVGIVRVLVKGWVAKGDPIRVSDIPGVGISAEYHTNIHAIESSYSSGIKLVKCII